jgi:predicted secreted protein
MPANNANIVYGGSLMLFAHTGSTVQPLAFSTSSKLEINLGTREISSRDSGNWKSVAAGKLDWNTSTDALVNYTSTGTTQSTDELYTYMVCRCPACINFAVACGTSPSWTVSGSQKKFTGAGIITSLSINSQDGDNATYSINIMGNDILTMS